MTVVIRDSGAGSFGMLIGVACATETRSATRTAVSDVVLPVHDMLCLVCKRT